MDLGQGILVHRKALIEVFQTLRALLDGKGSATVVEVRDALNIGRKTVVAYLEYFDRLKVTLRKEDIRVPGVQYQDFTKDNEG